LTMSPHLFSLLQDNEPDWVQILEASSRIEDTCHVDAKTHQTALHLAVLNRDPQKASIRLGVIRSLLQTNPEATMVQCHERGYSPLMYICCTRDFSDLKQDATIVKLLLECNYKSFFLRDKSGHSVLDIHLKAISNLHQSDKTTGQKCSFVLKALMELDLGVAIPHTLDLLLACNLTKVMTFVAQAETESFEARIRARKGVGQDTHSTPIAISPPHAFQKFWIWDFLMIILRAEHEHTYRDVKPVPPFNAVHTACQTVDFPLPFLILCTQVYARQVLCPSVIKANLPLHSVSSWKATPEMTTRKSMTITHLLQGRSSSATKKNSQGKTALSMK